MSFLDGLPTTSPSELLGFAEFVREVQQRTSDDIGAVLGELTVRAVQALPGAQYAGVTVARRRKDVETASSTGRYPVLLDELQGHYREGPCLSAAWEQRMIRISDLVSDQRWPRYRSEAIKQTPIRSIMSFPLIGDTQTAGALNFYAERADAFDDESAVIGLFFATHTALAWNMLRRDGQFRSALASRDIIGQAKGRLMERFHVDAEAAFQLIKRLSQGSNAPVAEVARRLVEADYPLGRP
ncbi:MAG: GAF and ANTAR domain-containing protein [Mycobacterium sp.]|nr:GAF and ANTAR domain-containing protein [Mycobacterium sp.]